MARYHVSLDGQPRKCAAQAGACPVMGPGGDPAPHGEFATAQEAQRFAEAMNVEAYGSGLESTSASPAERDYSYDPYCFVCRRATDHLGEHEALVDAGLAVYDEDGSVRRTSSYDEGEARRIADEEYEAYKRKFEF